MAYTIQIKGNASHLNKVLAQTKVSIGGLGQAAKAVGVGIAAAGVAIAAAAAAAGAFYHKMTLVGEAALTSEARLANIVKQMGFFGEGAKDVSDRLSELANNQARANGIDNKAIRMTQAKLATFKELLATADEVGGAFDRATQAAIDMAAAGFGEAEQNAVQLGKALNDPIKGITALARSGITFTAQEKEKVQALVESNKMLQAQDMVLKAIEKQVGGTAAATADASAMMKESFGQLVQEFAKPFAVSMLKLPGQLEAMFPALKEKAAMAGSIISTSLQDAIKGDLSGLVELGSIAGRAISEGIKLGLKFALVETGQKALQGLDAIGNFMDPLGADPKRALANSVRDGKADFLASSIEDAANAIRDSINAASAPVGVTPMAQGLFDQGVRGNDPGYRGTEMGKMLNTLEKIYNRLSPIKF